MADPKRGKAVMASDGVGV
jgi:hypothetical protein